VAMRTLILFFAVAVALAGCGDPLPAGDRVDADPLSGLIEQANEQTLFHQIELKVSTPLAAGMIYVYQYLQGEVSLLESRRYDNPDPELNLAYSAPVSSDDSAVLVHIVAAGLSAGRPDEYVCFAALDHSTSRHNASIACDLASTVTYYLAGDSVGMSGEHPFHDIEYRLPLWKALNEVRENDVVAFYVSVFGTLQNTLAGMGRDRFDQTRHSLRPVMETIITQFVDQYQRQGHITSTDLVTIANAVIDNALPIERITRYQTIYDTYAHIEDVGLKNTGGSLTQKVSQIELLTMASEVGRFYLRSSPFEMSDYRTHIVQNIRHHDSDTGLQIRWDPIPHMYGYNTYFNGQYLGYTRIPELQLESGAKGTVTIKAVGYAGEFDGVHHELAELSLLAGVSADAE